MKQQQSHSVTIKGPDGDVSSSQQFQVEAIIDKLIIRGKLFYKIQWKGYQDTTFEPLENVLSCTNLLLEFEGRHQSQTTLMTPRNFFSGLKAQAEEFQLLQRNKIANQFGSLTERFLTDQLIDLVDQNSLGRLLIDQKFRLVSTEPEENYNKQQLEHLTLLMVNILNRRQDVIVTARNEIIESAYQRFALERKEIEDEYSQLEQQLSAQKELLFDQLQQKGHIQHQLTSQILLDKLDLKQTASITNAREQLERRSQNLITNCFSEATQAKQTFQSQVLQNLSRWKQQQQKSNLPGGSVAEVTGLEANNNTAVAPEAKEKYMAPEFEAFFANVNRQKQKNKRRVIQIMNTPPRPMSEDSSRFSVHGVVGCGKRKTVIQFENKEKSSWQSVEWKVEPSSAVFIKFIDYVPLKKVRVILSMNTEGFKRIQAPRGRDFIFAFYQSIKNAAAAIDFVNCLRMGLCAEFKIQRKYE